MPKSLDWFKALLDQMPPVPEELKEEYDEVERRAFEVWAKIRPPKPPVVDED